jgi:hypothetical protein
MRHQLDDLGSRDESRFGWCPPSCERLLPARKEAGPDAMVFSHPTGEPMPPNDLSRDWRRAWTTLRLPRVMFHACVRADRRGGRDREDQQEVGTPLAGLHFQGRQPPLRHEGRRRGGFGGNAVAIRVLFYLRFVPNSLKRLRGRRGRVAEGGGLLSRAESHCLMPSCARNPDLMPRPSRRRAIPCRLIFSCVCPFGANFGANSISLRAPRSACLEASV